MSAYAYQLLLKHLLHQGVTWAPQQEIIYRDQMRSNYTTLYRRVLQLGGALLALGVKKGTKVGVIEWDSHRYLEMYFAIPGVGAVMHTVNPGLAAEDFLYTINHAEDEVLIFHEDFAALVGRLRTGMSSVRKFILIRDKAEKPDLGWDVVDYETLLGDATPLAELPDLDENTVATQSYTTGTTGKPKGVFFTQRQLTLQTLSDAVALSALGSYGGVSKHDVYMPLTPMFHGHAWGMPYVATMLGLKQVFAGRYEAPNLLRLIRSEGVTFSHCVPSILQGMITAAESKDVDLQRLKVIIGGSAMPRNLAKEAAKLGIQVYGGYGLSETCPVLTIANLKPFMEEWEDEKQLDWLIKPGFSIPLVYLKVVEPSGQEVVKNGKDTGEIVVRTPWCTPGYYKEEVLSQELWKDGWLHTGDIANVDEYGYIQIVDRLKDVIKSGGEWIVSLELERHLAQQEGVQDVAVIGVEDEKWGERPLAIVVARPGYAAKLTAEVLQAHLQKYVESGVLAAWAAPDAYVFVDEIPKTNVGKPDKKILRSQYCAFQK